MQSHVDILHRLVTQATQPTLHLEDGTDRSRFIRRNVMTDRLKKEDFVRLLATRMNTDEATATAWVDGIVETLFESFKDGKGVTLPGFGGFYVRPEPESWVFKFNPGQRLRALFGWSSTYSGKL
jgi:hypothetical protein